MKRILAIFATIAILGAFVVGCGGGDDAGTDSGTSSAEGGEAK